MCDARFHPSGAILGREAWRGRCKELHVDRSLWQSKRERGRERARCGSLSLPGDVVLVPVPILFFCLCSFLLFFPLIFVFLFLHSSPFDVRLSSLALSYRTGSKVMDVIILMKAQEGFLSWRTTTSWRNRSVQGTKKEAHNVTKWKHLWKYHNPDTPDLYGFKLQVQK